MAKTELSPAQWLVFGALVVVFFLTVLALALTKFEWLKRKTPMLVHWGRGGMRFPASKLGVCCSSLFGITIGLRAADEYARILTQETWALVLLGGFGLMLTVGILDLVRHRVISRNIRRPRQGYKKS